MTTMTTFHYRARYGVALLAALPVLGGCDDDEVSPLGPDPNLGLMEITISGITAPEQMSATARSISLANSQGSGVGFQVLDPIVEDGRAGIQLEFVRSGSVTEGERGAGGERHFFAVFNVRNADAERHIGYSQALEI